VYGVVDRDITFARCVEYDRGAGTLPECGIVVVKLLKSAEIGVAVVEELRERGKPVLTHGRLLHTDRSATITMVQYAESGDTDGRGREQRKIHAGGYGCLVMS
jgi:hypothetical protein